MVYLRIKGNGAGPIFLFQDGKTFVPLLAYGLTMQDSEGDGVQGSFSSDSF